MKTIAGVRVVHLWVWLMVAAVWGYFRDLRHGEYVDFVFRLLFVPAGSAFLYLVVRSFLRRDSE